MARIELNKSQLKRIGTDAWILRNRWKVIIWGFGSLAATFPFLAAGDEDWWKYLVILPFLSVCTCFWYASYYSARAGKDCANNMVGWLENIQK